MVHSYEGEKVSPPVPVELVIGLLAALIVMLIAVVVVMGCLATVITKKKKGYHQKP